MGYLCLINACVLENSNMAADVNAESKKSLEKQLIEAVEITLSPEVDQQLRYKAFEVSLSLYK